MEIYFFYKRLYKISISNKLIMIELILFNQQLLCKFPNDDARSDRDIE